MKVMKQYISKEDGKYCLKSVHIADVTTITEADLENVETNDFFEINGEMYSPQNIEDDMLFVRKVKLNPKVNEISQTDVFCPYCGENPDLAYYEEKGEEIECENCFVTFSVLPKITTTYTTKVVSGIPNMIKIKTLLCDES